MRERIKAIAFTAVIVAAVSFGTIWYFFDIVRVLFRK